MFVDDVARRHLGVAAQVVGQAALLAARQLHRLGKRGFELRPGAFLHLEADHERERLGGVLDGGLHLRDQRVGRLFLRGIGREHDGHKKNHADDNERGGTEGMHGCSPVKKTRCVTGFL
jgi:hypothetical protein